MIYYDIKKEYLTAEKVVYKMRARDWYYINFVPCGFDIETYTHYTKNEKGEVLTHFTNMYIAMFQFAADTFLLRTWDEVAYFFHYIEELYTSKNHKFLLFIHNNSFEFSFFKELQMRGFKIEVFARKKRKPMKIMLNDNIIILDSMRITGFSLATLAKNYTRTQKLVGELDYTIPRNRYTVLDKEHEEPYCINDVLILGEYAQVYAEKYLSQGKLPMTQTMVANLVMQETIKELKCSKDVYFLSKKLYPKTRQQYEYMLLFFAGAYTHGMLCNLFTTIENTLSFDMQSQYPYCTMSKEFPMSPFRACYTKDKYGFFIKTHCCLIDCTLKNVNQKYGVTILSKHKMTDIVNARWDNGRLYSCDSCHVFITEIDLETLSKFYTFELEIHHLSYAKRGYLPDYFRLTIAKLYAKKDRLKPMKDTMLAEYNESKQELNGEAYGACCTRLNFEEIYYDEDGWQVKEKDIDFERIANTKNKMPQWAIYITAHARACVLDMVYEIVKRDKYAYIYTDTDSLKVKNEPWIVELFEKKNAEIMKANEQFVSDLRLKEKYADVDFFKMGIFDNEHPQGMTRFKTIGSKKYLAEIDGEIEQTIAGLPKGTYVKWCEAHKLEPFDAFELGNVFIADNESNKLCTYYMDEAKQFTVTDLQGHTEDIVAYSYVSLIPTSFNIKDNDDLAEIYYYNNLISMNEDMHS